MNRSSVRRLGGAVVMALSLVSSSSHAGTATVTVHNATSQTHTLFDITANVNVSQFVSAPSTKFSLDDTHSYAIAPTVHYAAGAHQFSFFGGQVAPIGNSPVTSEWFVVSGNDISVRGIPLRFKLVTDFLGNGYQSLQGGTLDGGSGYAIPYGVAYLNGPDYTLIVTPADTNFDGTYSQFAFSPAANDFVLQLGTNFGIASITGVGASFVANGPFGGLLTLSNGNVLEVTAVPEPSALALMLFVVLCARSLWSKRLP